MAALAVPIIAGAVGGSILSKVMTRPAAVPEQPKPVAMPTQDDAAAQAARRRQIAQRSASSGRQSTILSQGANQSGVSIAPVNSGSLGGK